MREEFCFEDVNRARIVIEDAHRAGAIGYSDMLAINTLIDDFNHYEQDKIIRRRLTCQ